MIVVPAPVVSMGTRYERIRVAPGATPQATTSCRWPPSTPDSRGRSTALDESEPDLYHYPLDEDSYQEARFGSYGEKAAASDELRVEGDALGDQGHQLGFYTALMAVTLFLHGVAAVVRRPLMQWILIAVSLAAVLTALIPFVWIGF